MGAFWARLWPIIVFLTLLAGAVTAAKPIQTVRIVSSGDMNLACLWSPADTTNLEKVTVRWHINGEIAEEADAEVVLISGFEQAELWHANRDLKDTTLDTREKTEGDASLKVEFSDAFDKSAGGTHGLISYPSGLETSIADDIVYSVNLFMEDPSVLTQVTMRLGNSKTAFLWSIPYRGQPLQSGWNTLTFWGMDRSSDEKGASTEDLTSYWFLLDNFNENFHQTVRFDNFLQYTGVVLEASQTSEGDEIVCEVIPSVGKGVRSSVFTVTRKTPQANLQLPGAPPAYFEEQASSFPLWITLICGSLLVIFFSKEIYDLLKKGYNELPILLKKLGRR